MVDWLEPLLAEWPQFVAVFLGAAVGAILTVWLTNRAERRRVVEAAFFSLQNRITAMVATGFQTGIDLAGVVALGQDIAPIAWQSPGKKVRERASELMKVYNDLRKAANADEVEIDDILVLFAAHDRLGMELHGDQFVPLDVVNRDQLLNLDQDGEEE